MILKNVHGIFKGKENMQLKQEACRPDSSVFVIGFLATKKVPKASSNIGPNHSSGLLEVIAGHYLPNMKSLPKVKSGQIGVDSNIAQNH